MEAVDREYGDEYCPSCGQWHPLIADTGWCAVCTAAHYPDRCICTRCETTFERKGQLRLLCDNCRKEEWYERNADAIELYLSRGVPLRFAVEHVAYDNRPICLCCGSKIKGGTKGRHFFCTETTKCRQARRKYKYLVYERQYSKEAALSEVLQQVAA